MLRAFIDFVSSICVKLSRWKTDLSIAAIGTANHFDGWKNRDESRNLMINNELHWTGKIIIHNRLRELLPFFFYIFGSWVCVCVVSQVKVATPLNYYCYLPLHINFICLTLTFYVTKHLKVQQKKKNADAKQNIIWFLADSQSNFQMVGNFVSMLLWRESKVWQMGKMSDESRWNIHTSNDKMQ